MVCYLTYRTLPSLQGAGCYDVSLFILTTLKTGIRCENNYHQSLRIMLVLATTCTPLRSRWPLPQGRLFPSALAVCRPVCIPHVTPRPCLLFYSPFPTNLSHRRSQLPQRLCYCLSANGWVLLVAEAPRARAIATAPTQLATATEIVPIVETATTVAIAPTVLIAGMSFRSTFPLLNPEAC